jgi:hypothetical protein
MDLSICAPKNNHINYIIIILNFRAQWAGQFWVRVKTIDFSIFEMDLSICAPKNNHINCIIIIFNFVNLSLKENVRINVFILKVLILQPYGNNSTSGFFFWRIVFVYSQNGHHL